MKWEDGFSPLRCDTRGGIVKVAQLSCKEGLWMSKLPLDGKERMETREGECIIIFCEDEEMKENDFDVNEKVKKSKVKKLGFHMKI